MSREGDMTRRRFVIGTGQQQEGSFIYSCGGAGAA
jgi:hypothetical protein